MVEGLEHGRLALVPKVHHSIIDGVSGAEVMAAFFDLDAGPAPRPALRSDRRPAAAGTGTGADRRTSPEPSRARRLRRLVPRPAAGRARPVARRARLAARPGRRRGRTVSPEPSGRPAALSARNRERAGPLPPVAVRGAPDLDQPGHLAPPPGGASPSCPCRRPPGPRGARRHDQRRRPGRDRGRPALVLRRSGRRARTARWSRWCRCRCAPRRSGVRSATGSRPCWSRWPTGVADPVARLRADPDEDGRSAKEQSRSIGAGGVRRVGRGAGARGGHPADPRWSPTSVSSTTWRRCSTSSSPTCPDRTSRCIWPAPGWWRCTRSGPIIEGVGLNVTVFSYLRHPLRRGAGLPGLVPGRRGHRRGHGGFAGRAGRGGQPTGPTGAVVARRTACLNAAPCSRSHRSAGRAPECGVRESAGQLLGCRASRGRGSVGRASPCQGEGRGFESRRPLSWRALVMGTISASSDSVSRTSLGSIARPSRGSQETTSAVRLRAASAAARAWSRSDVACWYRRAATGDLWPARCMSSASVAPVAAVHVIPE